MPIGRWWLFTVAAAAMACGESTPSAAPPGPPPPAPPPPAPPPGFVAVLIAPNGGTMTVGDSLQFRATTNSSTLTGFVWAVDRADLASVDSTGLARGLKAGTVMVRACGKPQGSICGSVTLTVR